MAPQIGNRKEVNMKVEILIVDIKELKIRTRLEETGLTTTIQFDGKIPPSSIARILNLQRQGAPLLVSIGSPQATMDLDMVESNISQGAAHGD
jgi:hypothetical protein